MQATLETSGRAAAGKEASPPWDVVLSNYHPSWSGEAAEGLGRAGYRVLSLGSLRRRQPGETYRYSKMAWAMRHLGDRSPVMKEKILHAARDRMEAFAREHCLAGRCFWGWSGFSRAALERCRDAGVPTVLDTGSTHTRWCEEKLGAEFDREGVPGFGAGRMRINRKTLAEYELADMIAVPSEFVRETFVEQGVAPEKVFVNPFGVDGDLWGEVAKERAASAPGGPVVFVFAGAVMLRKGIAHLLRAWEMLAPEDAELWIVGGADADCRGRLEKLPAGVRLLGHRSWGELAGIYREADVYLLPSLEEGMARSVLEAMAAGLPVIVTRETGTAEVLVEGEDGWVVEAANAEALAEAMREAMDSRERLRGMGRAARARVLPMTWEAYGERAALLLEGLIGAEE